MTVETITEVEASVPPPTLAERARLVHLLRISLANAKEELDHRRRLWEEQNADWVLMTRQLTGELETADTALREAAIAAYAETSDKAPTPGVGIRLATVPVYEPADALAWAMEHSLALRLDVKTFEQIAKHGTVDVIVTFSQEPTATIAADLGKVLEVGE